MSKLRKTLAAVDLKTVSINVIIFLVLLLILEGIFLLLLTNVRLIPSFLLPAFKHYYQSSDRSIIQVSDCGQYDPGLFYTLKPGTCSFSNREFDVTFHVNSLGLRDDEASLTNPSIIVLGDSYAMGWGVEQEKTFPQLLEKLTGKKVLNAAISSFGTAREVKLFNRLMTDSAKTIILQYHGNDVEENLTYIENNFSLPIRDQQAYADLRSYISQRQQYYPFKHMYSVAKGIGYQMLHADSEVSQAKSALHLMEILNRSAIKKEKVRIILLKVGDDDYQNNAFLKAVNSLTETTEFKNWNIQTVSLSGIIDEKDYFILDDHINAQGHAKVANKLVDVLKATQSR